MAFTRFHYDTSRVYKQLQESTGPGRWTLNTPGQGISPLYYQDPHIRLEKWAGNVYRSPIDISSELEGRNVKLSKDSLSTLPTKSKRYVKNNYSTMKAYTSESRVTHPVSIYRDKEYTRWEYPLIDPQNPLFFKNNVNPMSSRILQKNNFIPKL
jgi:hypothetical protein